MNQFSFISCYLVFKGGGANDNGNGGIGSGGGCDGMDEDGLCVFGRLPLVQCQQKFVCMDPTLKDSVKEMIAKHADKYG